MDELGPDHQLSRGRALEDGVNLRAVLDAVRC